MNAKYNEILGRKQVPVHHQFKEIVYFVCVTLVQKYTVMKKQLWNKTSTYFFLIGICVLILLTEWIVISVLDTMHKGDYVNDDIAESVIFFVCIPGILAGIIGAIIITVRKK